MFTSTDGRILVCERIDHRDSWQFPQGGVDEGEPLDAAFAREMEEELGLRPEHYQVLKHRDGYRYEFPQQHRRFKKYVGQEQTYFLCQLTAPDSVIRLDLHKPEFASFKWINPGDFRLDWLPAFKRPVYQQVLQDFFGAAVPMPG